MTRISFATAAVLCSFIHIGCDSGTTQPFKGKQDGSTSAGGSDSDGASSTGGSAGDSSTGGSSGNASTGGRSGNASTGGTTGDAGSACGAVFGHAGECRTCLETSCCALGTACSKVADCPKLAQCTRDCDAKGSMPRDLQRSVSEARLVARIQPSGPVHGAVLPHAMSLSRALIAV